MTWHLMRWWWGRVCQTRFLLPHLRGLESECAILTRAAFMEVFGVRNRCEISSPSSNSPLNPTPVICPRRCLSSQPLFRLLSKLMKSSGAIRPRAKDPRSATALLVVSRNGSCSGTKLSSNRDLSTSTSRMLYFDSC